VSAPPLPDAFGNYALGEFVEVVSPAAISWLPQTAGWAWLGVVVLALAMHRGWRRLQRWHRNRYRREAAARLRQLSPATLGEQLVAEINKLLKLAAMAAYSRESVAGLYGENWTRFLNRQCADATFSAEQAALLATGAYRPVALDSATADALLEASLAWIRQHREPADA
jgi:hypothetical protein